MDRAKAINFLKEKLLAELHSGIPQGLSKGQNPEFFVKKNAKYAFASSALFGTPGGLIGAALAPLDALQLVRIQVKMCRDLAHHYEVPSEDVQAMIFWAFAAEVGIGTKNQPKIHQASGITMALAGQIAEKLSIFFIKRSLGKWGGWVVAPINAWFSYQMTMRLGKRFMAWCCAKEVESQLNPRPAFAPTKLPK